MWNGQQTHGGEMNLRMVVQWSNWNNDQTIVFPARFRPLSLEVVWSFVKRVKQGELYTVSASVGGLESFHMHTVEQSFDLRNMEHVTGGQYVIEWPRESGEFGLNKLKLTVLIILFAVGSLDC